MVFEAMLELLDKNKLMPYYAAERRIDLFINLFLEKILTAYYGEKVNFVVPEFPLKHKPNNQADKLDYLCAFDKTKQPIFIELKTDSISFNREQAIVYLEHAIDWPSCIEGLKAIIGNNKMRFSYREKYFQLMKRLHKEGLIGISGEGNMESVQWPTVPDSEFSSLEKPSSFRGERREFSRDLIKLSRHVYACWNGEAKLLYLVPHDDNLKEQIERVYREYQDKASVLDFSQIESLPIGSDMSYAQEFRKLVKFLKTLK